MSKHLDNFDSAIEEITENEDSYDFWKESVLQRDRIEVENIIRDTVSYGNDYDEYC